MYQASQNAPSDLPIPVLFVAPVGDRSGAATILCNLLCQLDRLTFMPIVACLADESMVREIREPGIPVQILKVRRDLVASGQAIFDLVRLIRREGIKLVHSSGEKAHIYGGIAARVAGVPEIWSCHALISGVFANRPLGRLAGLVPTTAAIAVSETVRTAMVQRYPHLAPIRLIYPGVGLPSRETTSYGVREEFGIADDTPIVGIAGRLQPGKGQHVFLEAAATVADELPAARFLVVGDALFGFDDDYRETLRQCASRLGIREQVMFTGFRRDVGRLLAAMNVVVHASLDPEPFGLVLIEAMVAARPVVASNIGGPREIVTAETGVLIHPGDPVALAAAIVYLLRNPARARAMGQAGRRRVEQLFTADRMARDTEALYREILALPGGLAHRTAG